jgi:hypothetical protein
VHEQIHVHEIEWLSWQCTLPVDCEYVCHIESFLSFSSYNEGIYVVAVLIHICVCCRRHCTHEPDWTMAAVLLDEYEGAGWQLMTDLIGGTKTAQDLIDSNPFVSGS